MVAKPNVPERELALFNIGMALAFHCNSFQTSFRNDDVISQNLLERLSCVCV